MSTGTVTQPAAIRGTYDPTRANFFCNFCRSYVQAPPRESGLRACPTPGCNRPTGFGPFARVPRPRLPERRWSR
jgi:hypothetical protein